MSDVDDKQGAAGRAAVASHLRRDLSLHSGRPETTPVGTPLLDEVL